MITLKHIDFHDLEIMSKTIFGEARGEMMTGRRAVGCVIMNRAIKGQAYVEAYGKPHPLFGNGSLADACQRPYQFSCWNKNDPNLPKLLAVSLGNKTFGDCVTVAKMVIEDSMDAKYAGRDPSRGACHYYVDGSAIPKWREGKSPCAIIGRHIFFNNIS